MNERLVFILLLCAMGVLWCIIGYWRRKAGEAAFAAARMAEQAEERDRYCRLAVMAGHRDACRMFCFSRPDLFEDHQVAWHTDDILRVLLSVPTQGVHQ